MKPSDSIVDESAPRARRLRGNRTMTSRRSWKPRAFVNPKMGAKSSRDRPRKQARPSGRPDCHGHRPPIAIEPSAPM